MATSIEQIRSFLDEHSLRYIVDSAHDTVIVGFRLDPEETTYRDHDGDPSLGLVIRILEDGEFLTIFTPRAWSLEDCPHAAAVLEAVATIQGQHKLLRFDYDPDDGEIRPNVELPLEDTALTSRLFHRLMRTMFEGVQRCDRVIREAMATGEVSMESLNTPESHDRPSADRHDVDALEVVRDEASRSALDRLQSLADEAGGVEQLERLTGGDWPVDPADAPVARAEAAEPPAQPVVRRIWDRLLAWRRSAKGGSTRGRGFPGEADGRKAG